MTRSADVYDGDAAAGRSSNYSRFNYFQDNIANGEPNDWRCRAGPRYLYVCEDGLVHYCSQQRGYPGHSAGRIYGGRLRREYSREKSCAPNCTVSCVHQISYIDHWRDPRTGISHENVFHPAPKQPELVTIQVNEQESANGRFEIFPPERSECLKSVMERRRPRLRDCCVFMSVLALPLTLLAPGCA